MRKYLVVKKNKTKLFIIIFILIIFTNSALGNSLITTIFIPEGIVMASDSRECIFINGVITSIFSDTATKLFLSKKHKIGISSWGIGALNDISITNHIRNFIGKELTNDDDIITVTNKLFEYFKNISVSNENIYFHVAGYKKENKVSVPYVYFLNIKDNLIKRMNIDSDNKIDYGITCGGETDILYSIFKPVKITDEKGNEKTIKEVDPFLWEAMTLQDAIDFSIYAIRTTIDTMRSQDGPQTVGGPIDVLLISPEEAKFIQNKELQGELIKIGINPRYYKRESLNND